MNSIKVYVEVGKKKTFASAMDWPGWSRGGRDEGAAIGAGIGAITGGIIGNQMEEKKVCPECGRKFDSKAEYCPYDGVELKPVEK